MKNYNPEIDCLRAIAAMSVIFYHTEIIIFNNLVSKSGFIGVDIFIVISGFVITKLFFNKNFSYIEFAENRKGAKREIMIDQFTNSKKIKILICGDSHGADLTMALQSNKNIHKKYEVEFIHFLDCINEEPLLIKNADYIFSSIQLKGKNNLTYNDIKKLYNIVTIKNNKKFIIVGASPEFQTDADLLLNYLTITNIKKEEVINNVNNINKFFFKNKKTYISTINKKLLKISKELDVIFLDKFDLICKEKDKICYGVDFNGNKNFIDYSHFSKNGRVFFGNKIVDTNWLKIN